MTQLITNDDDHEEIKEYHLKRLLDLCLKSLGEIPQLEEPSFEQEEWVKGKRFHK